jgi:hypothetical protein
MLEKTQSEGQLVIERTFTPGWWSNSTKNHLNLYLSALFSTQQSWSPECILERRKLEDTKMKMKILAGLLIGASALAAAPRVSIGIGFGVPVRHYYAPAPVYVAPAPYSAPAYVAPAYGWTAGYWDGYGPRRVWRPGYRIERRDGFRYRR